MNTSPPDLIELAWIIKRLCQADDNFWPFEYGWVFIGHSAANVKNLYNIYADL